MTSRTEIANMAVSHLGIGEEIANLDTEQSEAASACRRFFDISRKATLGDHNWTFATAEQVLGLVEADPSSEWSYSYRYPTDCLDIRRIKSGIRNDTHNSRIRFKILIDSAGRLIYSDMDSAEIEYTMNVTDSEFFSPEFVLAFSFRLASYVAPRLTGGDPFKLKEEMLAQYRLELGLAKIKDMNEETKDLIPESEMISVRS